MEKAHSAAVERTQKALGARGAKPTASISGFHQPKLATKPTAIDGPRSAMEVEADRVASAVAASKPVAVRCSTHESRISRQGLAALGPALEVLGTGLLVTDAKAAPAEAAAGPVGWAVGIGVAVAGLAILGVGALVSGDAPAKEQEEPKPEKSGVFQRCYLVEQDDYACYYVCPGDVPLPVPKVTPEQVCPEEHLIPAE